MIPSVSSITATEVASPPATAPSPKPAPAPVQTSAPVTVEISISAQVKQLDAGGSSVSEIALKTGLDTATVKQYLGD